jgi:hypothetical protein
VGAEDVDVEDTFHEGKLAPVRYGAGGE